MSHVPIQAINRDSKKAIPEWTGKLILRAKTKFIFGKIMLPESTCGKLILPFGLQFIDFGDWLRVNSGKLMLPSVAILWV